MKNNAYPSAKQSFGVVGIALLAMLVFAPFNYYLNDFIKESASFLVYYILAMGTTFLLVHFLKKKSEGSVSYQFIPKDFLAVILILLGTIALQWGVTSPIANLIPMPESFKEIFRDLALKMDDGYGLIAVAFAAPFFEELIFRGVVLDGLLKRRSVWSAILISSFMFGIVHLNPWQFISAMVIGCFAGWIYYRTKNLSYSILVHFFNNFGASMYMKIDPSSMTMEKNLTETYGGTENMYLIIGLCILTSLACIYALNKRLRDERGPDETEINLQNLTAE